MGVPKFYRWISERYPKINQPIHCPPNPDTLEKYFPSDADIEDENSNDQRNDEEKDKDNHHKGKKRGNARKKLDKEALEYARKSSVDLMPEFDRLYLDMNGIIHCCSHNNASEDDPSIDPDIHLDAIGNEPSLAGKNNNNNNSNNNKNIKSNGNNNGSGGQGTINISNQEIFRNVCYYIDRVVTDIARPKELVYMAIDGVAPRAKMNQQRSRRYRSGKEREIESIYYGAYMQKKREEEEKLERRGEKMKNEGDSIHGSYPSLGEEVYGADAWHLNLDKDIVGNNNTNVDKAHNNAAKNIKKQKQQINKDMEEMEPTRLAGTFETSEETKGKDEFDLDYDAYLELKDEDESSYSENNTDNNNNAFHSNNITPGTQFFDECTQHLEHFVKYKLHTDPRWKHLTIIFSGPNVPGEGEHKIMDFLRHEKTKHDYNPNTRHCLFGQDGDLIMLGLASHEPNFCLLREEVVFNQARKKAKLKSAKGQVATNTNTNTSATVSASLASYMHNSSFELLHLSILRDYISYDFETSDVIPDSPFHLEPTIDDFVFMTFFVGNDFLPHMPALDIADEAFDLLFYTYKKNRSKWIQDGINHRGKIMENKEHSTSKKKGKLFPYPHLTYQGNIVSGTRLESFLSDLGKHEDPFFDNKKRMDRKGDKGGGWGVSTPRHIIAAKEKFDKNNYKDMLRATFITNDENVDIDQSTNGHAHGKFSPVISSGDAFDKFHNISNSHDGNTTITKNSTNKFKAEVEEELDDGIMSRMGSLILSSLTPAKSGDSPVSLQNNTNNNDLKRNDINSTDANISPVLAKDIKGRYYFDKFKFTPVDAAKHIALRKAYIEGLVWNLKYYYEGCVSWDWFYPYHYGPMLSDIVNIDVMLNEISFGDRQEDSQHGGKQISQPLKPFEQLLGCLPPSSADILPRPYRWLMKSPQSPIIDFYPQSFTIDMNGKKWPWEAVVLLPFIDSKRLRDAVDSMVGDNLLSPEEISRNQFGKAFVFFRDENYSCDVNAVSDSQNFGPIIGCHVRKEIINDTKWVHDSGNRAFKPELLPGTIVPYDGFPTLKDAPIRSLSRRNVRINVFGKGSRYKTSVLQLDNDIPKLPSAKALASKFIGTNVYFRYPLLQEGFITSVSDAEQVVRGTYLPKRWNVKEAEAWQLRNDALLKRHEKGEGLTGTGGWSIPNSNVILTVRPLQETRILSNGTKVKMYAKAEVEVPLVAALWSPSSPNSRFSNIPAMLEKNPYQFHNVKGLIKMIKQVEAVKANVNYGKDSKQEITLPTFKNVINARGSLSDTKLPSLRPLPSFTSLQNTSSASNLISGKSREYSNYSALPMSNRAVPYVGMPSILPYNNFDRNIVEKNQVFHQRTRDFISCKASNRFSKVGNLRTKAVAVIALGFSICFSANAHLNLCRRKIFQTRLMNDYERFSNSKLDIRGGAFFDSSMDDCNIKSTPPLEFAHGTTTISFKFREGIIAAVDSRASIGNFVGSKTVQKVLPVSKNIIGTMAGGAADCSFWIRKLQSQAKLYELSEGTDMTVSRASRMLANFLYENRGLDLSIGTMIMGYDNIAGPSIYYVDNTGRRLEGNMFAVGSGSTFALGVLDTEFKDGLTESEAVSLGIKAIRHATFRDAFSGGFIAVYVITSNGWRKVFSEDLALSAGNVLNDINANDRSE